MLVYDAVAGALPLLIISERYAFSPKFESECQGGYAADLQTLRFAHREGSNLHFRSQIIFGEILIYILALLCATLGTAVPSCVLTMRNPCHCYVHPGLE